MKIRTGFVSNSSSSSFVCEVCGDVESGYDVGARDVGFYECEHGHEFCASHALPTLKKFIKAASEAGEDLEFDEDGGYEVPEALCPICQLTAASDSDMLTFLLKTNGTTRDQVMANIRDRFTTRSDFHNFLKDRQ